MDTMSKAATVIQAYYRGFATRKNLKEQQNLKTQEKAATKIQSNYRGFKTRKQISKDMETGAIAPKKKKKRGKVKYVWDKMKHCWTRFDRFVHKEHRKKEQEDVQTNNELWELSQHPEGESDVSQMSESEEESDGYKIPRKKDRPLTLLELREVYDKKHKADADKPPMDATLAKYGAPLKSPYQSAYGHDVTPYSAYDCAMDIEIAVPPKPHKVIKYVVPEPEVKPAEETGFFSRFKRRDASPERPKEENVFDQMGGKFMGLFTSKPEEPTPVVKAEPVKPDELKQEQDGLYGKFQGFFKPKAEESKPTPTHTAGDKLIDANSMMTAEKVDEVRANVGHEDDDQSNDSNDDYSDEEKDNDDDDDDKDDNRPCSEDDEEHISGHSGSASEDDDNRSDNSKYSEDENESDADEDDGRRRTPEPAAKSEFQLKFMNFLKKDKN